MSGDTKISRAYPSGQYKCDDHHNEINLESHLLSHSNKLALIIGNDAFTNQFAEYCSFKLSMKAIEKTLEIASSFHVMDSDEFKGREDWKNNLIHSPFYTNKEHKYRYKVQTIDYFYYFINCNHFNLMQTLKLIDYANKINVSCIVIITNCFTTHQQSNIHQIESYLLHNNVNYIIFKVHSMYLPNDTDMSANHDIALLIHQIIKNRNDDQGIIANIFNDQMSVLHFDDIIPYIAVSVFYDRLYGQTYNVKSSNIYSAKYLQNKIKNLVQSRDQRTNGGRLVVVSSPKFNCHFLGDSNRFIPETPMDDILSVIYLDLQRNQDLIAQKREVEDIYTKSAVLCDNRFDDSMIDIVLNFMINLDQQWQFQLFVGKTTKELWANNEYLSPYIKTGKIILDELENYFDENPLEYYQNINFWKAIKHEKILIFQTDSVLCSNSKFRVEDFLQFDFVGAPWKVRDKEFNGRVGNGGLSLRTKSVMIHLLETYPPHEQLEELRNLNEDCYLNKFIALLPGVHLPTYRIAKRFAMETDLYGLHGHDISAGVHRHFVKDEKDWNSLVYRCVEFNLTFNRVKFGRSPNLMG